jgi:hypothetical protein
MISIDLEYTYQSLYTAALFKAPASCPCVHCQRPSAGVCAIALGGDPCPPRGPPPSFPDHSMTLLRQPLPLYGHRQLPLVSSPQRGWGGGARVREALTSFCCSQNAHAHVGGSHLGAGEEEGHEDGRAEVGRDALREVGGDQRELRISLSFSLSFSLPPLSPPLAPPRLPPPPYPRLSLSPPVPLVKNAL